MNPKQRASAIRAISAVMFSASTLLARELTFDERVAAQKAIEQVYWSHRLWPTQNPRPKPPLSSVMSEETIRSKVEDYLQKSDALMTWWQRPITDEQLQAELDRMVKGSRDPQMLRELFAALGNDPFVIAETLGRQTLADRLIRNWFAGDRRFQTDARAKAEAALASCSSVDCMRSMHGDYRELVLKRGSDAMVRVPQGGINSVVYFAPEEWGRELDSLAKRLGGTSRSIRSRELSSLEETPEWFGLTTLLSQNADEIRIASVQWPKQPFDDWWRIARAPRIARTQGAPRGSVPSSVEKGKRRNLLLSKQGRHNGDGGLRREGSYHDQG